jgi:hypothetical protein
VAAPSLSDERLYPRQEALALLQLDSGYSAGMTLDGRWRCYSYDECMARDKAGVDIFWFMDDSPADSDNLTPPEVIA